jgi:hypothetical protein
MSNMFFVFGGDNYYPGGGMSDLCGTYATLEEAVASTQLTIVDEDGDESYLQWWQVVTVIHGQLVTVERGRNDSPPRP